jgi:uncharacterized membrane protein (GlpM family)
MLILTKAMVSAVVIAGVNLIARQNPGLGGYLAALPWITLLSLIWLTVDHRGSEDVDRFLVGVLWGVIPTVLFLLIAVVALRRGLPLAAAVAGGCLGWLAYTSLARYFGALGL